MKNEKRIKATLVLLILFSPCFKISAQETIPTSGGVAIGAGGSVSYSAEQPGGIRKLYGEHDKLGIKGKWWGYANMEYGKSIRCIKE
ncbi:MAG: hypothetical protein R6U65_08515 [Perlabentimonas sp.]